MKRRYTKSLMKTLNLKIVDKRLNYHLNSLIQFCLIIMDCVKRGYLV